MPHFFLRLNPPRADFARTMTAEERAAMGRHAAYLHGLLERGRVLAFGPVADPAGMWGLGIAEAEDLQAVRALAEADPVVASGLGFHYDVFPMPSAVVRGAPAHSSEDARRA